MLRNHLLHLGMKLGPQFHEGGSVLAVTKRPLLPPEHLHVVRGYHLHRVNQAGSVRLGARGVDGPTNVNFSGEHHQRAEQRGLPAAVKGAAAVPKGEGDGRIFGAGRASTRAGQGQQLGGNGVVLALEQRFDVLGVFLRFPEGQVVVRCMEQHAPCGGELVHEQAVVVGSPFQAVLPPRHLGVVAVGGCQMPGGQAGNELDKPNVHPRLQGLRKIPKEVIDHELVETDHAVVRQPLVDHIWVQGVELPVVEERLGTGHKEAKNARFSTQCHRDGVVIAGLREGHRERIWVQLLAGRDWAEEADGGDLDRVPMHSAILFGGPVC
mmetsp:Transcript_145891/g.254698  ORF Transcript_145891/g.254698 Transcript_145891/m.254698 type:complete len:323 (-) Transcript_145891:470-1438(-)